MWLRARRPGHRGGHSGDVDPLAGFGRIEDGVADDLGGLGLAEGGAAGAAGFEGFEEIGDLVDERVLVADLQAGDTPVFHVGLVAIGDVDVVPAADDGLVRVIEDLEAVYELIMPVNWLHGEYIWLATHL